MRVELPRLLAVLAHELRGPLSVVQGYTRLLRQSRGDEDPETAMLDAVMEQTRRLSALGRQATDLANWLERPGDASTATIAAEALAVDVAARVASPLLTVTVSPAVARATIHTRDSAALATALAAVAGLVIRDATGAPVALVVAPAGDAHVAFTAGPSAHAPHEAASTEASAAFDRGGLGLALVFASYVLDAHGARATAPRPGTIEVQLPKDGEAA